MTKIFLFVFIFSDQSFQVIDTWEDKESNGSFPQPGIDIKKEPLGDESLTKRHKPRTSSKEARTPRSRTESDRSDASNRDPRRRHTSREKENTRKIARIPDRRRSPPRRRLSPLPRQRSRSPQRRRPSTPRERDHPRKKPSFLEEMKQKFPDIASSDQNQNRFNGGHMQFNNAQMQMGYPMMQGPNFMQNAGFVQPQPYAYGSFPNYGQPFAMNQFNNHVIIPEMNPVIQSSHITASPVYVGPPAPVPAPSPREITPQFVEERRPKPAVAIKKVSENPRKPASNDIQHAKKKVG